MGEEKKTKAKQIEEATALLLPMDASYGGDGRDDVPRQLGSQKSHWERDLLSKILNSSPAFIVAIDRDGKARLVNQSMLEALGHSLHQVEGKDYVTTFVPKRDRKKVSQVFEELLSRPGQTRIENFILARDGRELLVEWHGCSTVDQNGVIDQFIGVGIDITERRQVEDKLRNTEVLARETLDAQADTFFVFNPTTGRALRWNRAFREVSGYTDAEISELPAPESYYSEEDLKKAAAATETLVKRGETTVEMDLICKDGRRIPFEYRASLIQDERGRPIEAISIGRDITDRKRVHQNLVESEARFRSIVENMPITFFTFDRSGRILAWNSAAERMYGYTRKEALGSSAYDLIVTPETKEATEEVIARVFQGETAVGSVWRDRNKDGELGWRMGNTFPLFGSEGVVSSGVNMNVDITEQQEATERLKESEERYRNLIENIPSVTWVTVGVEEFQFVSPNIREMTGYTPDQITEGGVPFWVDKIHPEDRQRVSAAFSDDVHRGSGSNLEYQVRTAGGDYIWVEGRTHTLLGRGEVAMSVGNLIDITERKRAEEALRKSEKKFSKIFHSSPDSITLTSIETGEIVELNNGFERIFGYTQEEALGNTTLQLGLWRSHEDRARMTAELQATGTIRDLDIELESKTGEVISCLVSGEVIEIQSERFLLAITRDISDRKRAQEVVRISEEKFAASFRNNPNPMALIDVGTRTIMSVNDAYTRLTGYAAEEVVGIEGKAGFLIRSEGHLLQDLWEGAEAGQHFESVEIDLTTKNLGERTLLLYGETIGIHDRQVFIVTLVDITERKQKEEELEHANREIRKLKERLEAENVYLRKEVRQVHLHGEIVGKCGGMSSVLALAERVAITDSSVLILGETGTGKELVARAIHNMSRRKDRSLVVVNCAAVPSTLVEGELFGREKGAFTGAMTKQLGRFEIADGSTIFLDEIGELPADAQSKLLRVLQEGELQRLGSSSTIRVDVRVVAATNRDLEQEVTEGRFRKDLYYRLNVFPIEIPPLRERREDIAPLVWSFVTELNEKMGRRIERIGQKTIDAMTRHQWRGNVRELRNAVERAMILANGSTLSVNLPPVGSARSQAPRMSLEDVDREHIREILESVGWRIRGTGGAAEILGLKPSTLESRMGKLGICRPHERTR